MSSDPFVTAFGPDEADDARFQWALYARWAIAPLMDRDQWIARRLRIDAMAAAGTLPTNPYEW